MEIDEKELAELREKLDQLEKERFIKLMDAEEGELRRKAEKWDRVEDTHEFKFVRHIESHLSGNQVPICTICGKTIFEIALEGKEG